MRISLAEDTLPCYDEALSGQHVLLVLSGLCKYDILQSATQMMSCRVDMTASSHTVTLVILIQTSLHCLTVPWLSLGVNIY